jgi:hypothetical protein
MSENVWPALIMDMISCNRSRDTEKSSIMLPSHQIWRYVSNRHRRNGTTMVISSLRLATGAVFSLQSATGMEVRHSHSTFIFVALSIAWIIEAE